MTIYAQPGSTFVPYVSNAPTGDAGAIGLRLHDPVTNTDVIARFTAGIVETPANSGIYYAPAQTAPLTKGTYQLIWDSPGSPPDAVEDLIVTYTQPGDTDPVDLCLVSDVVLRFGTTDDPPGVIQAAITAASRTANQRYNREFTPQTSAQTRQFRMDSSVLVFPNDDLRAASAVVLDPNGSPTTLQATDYRLQPAGLSTLGTYTGLMVSQLISIVSGTSLAFGYAEVAITGDWGAFSTATVPEDIRNACVETVGSWLDRAVAEYSSSIAGQDDDFQAAPDRFAGYAIPPSAHSVFTSYGRTTLR